MSLGRSGPGVQSGFLETPRTRFGGVFLASAQTASQSAVPGASTPRVRRRSEAVDVDHGQLVGRRLKACVDEALRLVKAPTSRRRAGGSAEALAEIERLLLAASGGTPDAETPRASRPRLGGISFLHRFGSALNHHVHLHACVTDGVFVPAADHVGCDALPTFLPARPITPSDLASLTERVRRRVVRWFCMQRLLDAAAAADMLAWVNSGFSIDASVRITLNGIQLRVYCQHLEHLLRYCARPPFALERLSVIRDADGRIIRIRYVLPRHTTPATTSGAGPWPAHRLGRARPGSR